MQREVRAQRGVWVSLGREERPAPPWDLASVATATEERDAPPYQG